MEEQKRRAEADKLAAITALEQRSREFMREKEEKRRLEARIANMQSQLLIGGSKLEDTPVFRWVLLCAAAAKLEAWGLGMHCSPAGGPPQCVSWEATPSGSGSNMADMSLIRIEGGSKRS